MENSSVRQTTHVQFAMNKRGREGKEKQKEGRECLGYLTEIEFENSCDDMGWSVRQIGMMCSILKCLRRLKQRKVKREEVTDTKLLLSAYFVKNLCRAVAVGE